MANESHVKILKEGVRAWNQWRSQSEEMPDLREAELWNTKLMEANLAGANLHFAHFGSADLSSANLSGAQLNGAFLINTNFSDANLSNANLSNAFVWADLVHSNLSGANLTHADISCAYFRCANLSGANFFEAEMSWTTLADVDLSVAIALETVRHRGPSSIGIDTIYKSHSKIPQTFLRGCGVPETLVREIRSLIKFEDRSQFYSCFISYSTTDKDFADQLYQRMRDIHLRVWYAPQDLQGGRKAHEQVEAAIRRSDKVLTVLSEASLQSEWVMTELRNARKAERESGKRKLFPVRLVDFETLRDWECFDADSGKDLAVELREYFIPDFSNWKDHVQFEAAFARLLKDLRAEERAKQPEV